MASKTKAKAETDRAALVIQVTPSGVSRVKVLGSDRDTGLDFYRSLFEDIQVLDRAARQLA